MPSIRFFPRGLGRTTTLALTLAGVGFGTVPHANASPFRAMPIAPLLDGGSEKTAGDLGAVFVNAVDRMLQESPSGKKSARENAYSALIAVWIAACTSGAGNVVGMTGFGAGVGGALGGMGGAAVGSAFAGIGAAPGAAAGAGVGGTAGAGAGLLVGTQVTAAEFLALAIVTVAVVDHIESKYPQTASRAVDGAPVSTMGYISSSNRGAWAMAASTNAGVAESMFIHMMDTAFTDSMLQIADKWTAMPGLTNGQREQLARYDYLRPAFERIAFIKRNKRVSSSSKPALPLAGWAKTAQGVLHGDQQSVRDAWVAALGVGEVGFNVNKGRLQIKPGKALRDAGAPELIEVQLPTLSSSLSVGPAKASVSLVPGNFGATVSRAEAITSGEDVGRIRVKFSASKGTTTAVGSASFEAPGVKGSVSVDLKAAQQINGEVLFKLDGRRLAVAKVTINGLSADVGVGSLPGPASALLQGIKDKAAGEAAKVLDQSKVTSAFEGLAKESTDVLAASVNGFAAAVGMVEIEAIEKLRVEAGKVVLDVRGKHIDWPLAPDISGGLAALKAAQAAPKGKSAPTQAMPSGLPKGLPRG